eukprot:CAMPEP_0117493630 /NCGR_PEP_ID=MMETSP0784-20121206/19196_1 /TAXON_ID=39447 /ORGANISM="" /LENGTH=710 /DNA_ID=CAMNT_0005288487 /DNA_START=42 /DNA_END=2174 /DNA_ORIENTATION=+
MSGSEDEDDAEDGDEDLEAGRWCAADEDEGKVQRKLHLFQNAGIQRSIKRLWVLLPRDEQGRLPMEGYINLNLMFQRCLSKEFDLERAVASAVDDWADDAREGQQCMQAEDFAMFLFELASLWCGPTVSLQVYLLFLNALFIAVTDARGSHTIGLKALDAVECLPDDFFELLSVQGWASLPEDEQGLDEEHALATWYARNLSPESEKAARLQAQRQVFQVTHDVRSVLLFPSKGKDGRQREDQDSLQVLRLSSRNLGKVESQLSSADRVVNREHGGPSKATQRVDLCAFPWLPTTHARHPGVRGAALAANAEKASAPAPAVEPGRRGRSPPRQHRHGSLPAVLDRSRPQKSCGASSTALALPSSMAPSSIRSRPSPAEVPAGRAYDVVEARRPRGLVLAGKNTLKASALERTADEGPKPEEQPPSGKVSPFVDSPALASWPEGEEPSEVSQKGEDEEETLVPITPDFLAELKTRLEQNQEDLAVLYRLPNKPVDLYKMQWERGLKLKPSNVVYDARRTYSKNTMVSEPFDRSLKRLPEHFRPQSEGPAFGPLAHPTEPVWFNMAHRLQAILKRQGRRAERRRKKRLRAKLTRSRSRKTESRREVQELRHYLDGKALEHMRGTCDQPGEANGDFLRKVHERYLLHQDRLETKPFRYSGTGGARVDVYSMGETAPRPQAVVRPIYVPPLPEATASGGFGGLSLGGARRGMIS